MLSKNVDKSYFLNKFTEIIYYVVLNASLRLSKLQLACAGTAQTSFSFVTVACYSCVNAVDVLLYLKHATTVRVLSVDLH